MKRAAYAGCLKTPPVAHAGKEYATMTESGTQLYPFPEMTHASNVCYL